MAEIETPNFVELTAFFIHMEVSVYDEPFGTLTITAKAFCRVHFAAGPVTEALSLLFYIRLTVEKARLPSSPVVTGGQGTCI